ncbi:transport permease protein [Sphaerisporangium melleum]|uniref:Transport permease protein n=1 Tax=Sphaerisporangium melleum TaxID=321316 RepID=A0A917REA0_9ACTN|nr:ABC transporter permease [Sphaerisporangium melleum]GGL02303.1 transport permease protein [Sphaerisporangium melleum]GII72232.1 transport permease protein [Sphaerisporangium melleum]
MMTTMIAARLAPQGAAPGRVGAVIGRNLGALRSGPSYWLVLLSGFFEPLLYLLSIGVGVGALVGELTVAGRALSYAAYVAPAMLAVSAMTGALAETTFNFFHKMKYQKVFDAMLATPVRPLELALGELGWAMIRGSLYTAVFLLIMVGLGLAEPLWALAAFPATVLVGVAFGACGMAVSTLMRGWQDFDLITTGQFALFLFSGTFSPVGDYPAAVQVLVQVTPLYHAIELVRGLCIGDAHLGLLGHAAYLCAMAAAGLWFAARRLQRRLCV